MRELPPLPMLTTSNDDFSLSYHLAFEMLRNALASREHAQLMVRVLLLTCALSDLGYAALDAEDASEAERVLQDIFARGAANQGWRVATHEAARDIEILAWVLTVHDLQMQSASHAAMQQAHNKVDTL